MSVRADHHLVPPDWNATETAYPAERCLHELIEAQVARTPAAIAVRFEEQALTYAALNACANRLARKLVACGVGPDVRVGVCLPRGLELMVALLGVLKAGGAYVPLDSGYPGERLAGMLEDAAAPVLLVDEAWTAATEWRVPADTVVMRVPRVPEHDDISADAIDATNLPPRATPSNLAYVIFTSGSTGRPKGAMNAHVGIVNRLCWMQARYGLDEADVVLQKTPVSFDVSVWELFWPLMQGACLVLARPDGHRDPAYLQALIAARRVTTLHFVPSMLPAFLDVATPAGCASLRRVICSGEALPPSLVARAQAQLPAETVIENLYGPTEAAVDVSYWRCAASDAQGASLPSSIPIGRPVWNTQLHVLDAALQATPVGVAGELYIGGVQVARGYVRRPGLTASRFVPDPFGPTGARLYRTGDKARWREDGALEYLGRLDAQVKLRGFRIELGEIETAIQGVSGVIASIVLAREDTPGEPRLVAYVAGSAAIDRVRDALRRQLPDYMMPAAFVTLDALPLTPNGKIDRRALPAPTFTSEEPYAAPATADEDVLAAIWSEVLGQARVGRADDFLALGGHSILAMCIAARVREQLGLDLSVRALFEHPTLAALAAHLVERRASGVAAEPSIEAMSTTATAGAAATAGVADGAAATADAAGVADAESSAGRGEPLSFAQERLWFLDRFESTRGAYHLADAWRLRGALDAAALERAIATLVARHEALRTSFVERDGAALAFVAPFDGFTLPIASCTPKQARDEAAANADDDESSSANVDADAVIRRVRETRAAPFDLATGPLFRAHLWRIASDDHVLALSMHHIISDGWSRDILFRELAAAYEAERAGARAALRPLPIRYADYARWQRAWLHEGATVTSELAHWRTRLAGAPAVIALPTDHVRPASPTWRGARVPITLPPSLLDRLQTLAREEAATPYMLVLAAFQMTLAKYTGSRDIIVGSPIAGRNQRSLETLVGFFVNTLAMRTDLAGDPTLREALRRVRETTLEAYEHDAVPFERIVADLQPVRTTSHAPIVQVMCTVQDDAARRFELRGLAVERLDVAPETAMFDLSLDLAPTSRGFEGALTYSRDLFEPETAARMARHVTRVLETLAATPDARLSTVALLDAAEQSALLALGQPLEASSEANAEASAGANTGADTGTNGALDSAAVEASSLIPARIAAQAERRPQAVAVRAADETLTYAELQARASRLAQLLRTLGVGPETRVGICVRRGVETVVAPLAALGAGAAYVPFDPSTPAARLRWLGADAGIRVLLTEQSLAEIWTDASDASRASDASDAEGYRVIALDAPETHAALAAQSTPAPEAQPTPTPTATPTPTPAPTLTPRHAAYVIYTSGTTGTPKGVVIEHGSLARLCAWHAAAFAIDDTSRATHVASPAFDAAVWEVWPYLAIGAQVTITPEAVRTDPTALRDWLIAEAITIAFVPTPLAAPLIALDWPRPGHLRWLLTGGDRLTAYPPVSLPFAVSNNYGPTESTVVATSGRVPPLGPPLVGALDEATAGAGRTFGASAGPSIGRPIAHTRLVIADEGLNLLPAGVPGDLYLGGAQLARGYWKRAALTADRFIPDPFATTPGSRLYRTGDRARWRVDGTLEFLGRADTQVKIRGFRIEPGEIEATLRELPGVRDAIVIADADTDAERLLAFIVCAEDAAQTKAASDGVRGDAAPVTPSSQQLRDHVRDHVRAHLPAYMVPAAITVIDALPLTANGKVDRDALRALVPAATADADGELTAPQSIEEETLAAIWADALGLTRVGRKADFFALGGHSLLAMRVVARARETFDVDLPVHLLFSHSTLSAFAAEIAARRRQRRPARPAIVAATQDDGPAPLSFAQERLWFLDRLQPGSSAYHIHTAWRLAGPLAIDALRRAFAEVVARHAILRTCFPQRDGTPVQVVRHHPSERHQSDRHQSDRPLDGFALEVTSLDLRGDDDVEETLRARMRSELERPFDLENGPPFRACLFRIADDDHVLSIALHHIAADGASVDRLVRELSTRYDAHHADGQRRDADRAGADWRDASRSGAPSHDGERVRPIDDERESRAPGSAPPRVQYTDYARWERATLQGDALASDLEYWQAALADLPPVLALETDHPRPAQPGPRSAEVAIRLDAALRQALEALCRQEGATLYMGLLAAFQLFLARQTGQRDLCVGSPVATARPGAEELIGLFLNTLVLRGRVDEAGDFRTLLRAARRTALEAFAHQDLPFAQLVDALQQERSLHHTPLVQALLVFHDGPAAPLALSGIASTTLPAVHGAAKFDLTLTLVAEADGLTGSLRYDPALFEPETIARMAARFETLLRAVVRAPDAAIAEMALLPDAERQQIAAWSDGRNATGAAPVAPASTSRASNASASTAATSIASASSTAEAVTTETSETFAPIHEIIARQALKAPHAIALVWERATGEMATMDHGTLQMRANQLAHRLRAAGVREDDAVGLIVDRTAEAIVGLLAIQAAGGAYVPIEATAPPARIAALLRDAGVRAIVSPRHCVAADRRDDDQPSPDVELFIVDAHQPLDPTLPITPPANRLAPSNMAYLIFTSGSTGRPKAVAVEHRQLANYVHGAIARLRLPAGASYATVSTLAADLGHTMLFPALAQGGTLHLVSTACATDPAAFAAYLRRWPIDCLKIVPSHLATLLGDQALTQGDAAAAAAERLPRQRLVLGGEASARAWVETLCDSVGQTAPHCLIFNHYGPTETTVGVLTHEAGTPVPPSPAVTLPLGRPLPNAAIHLLDRYGTLAPIGVAGEIHIGGAGVARGYHRQPGLTADRFRPDPFASQRGARMYRTGDRGRRLSDGQVEFLGRIDHQVKLRGYRVEPGEVEAALRGQPGVEACAIIARDAAGANPHLVAYVVGPGPAETSRIAAALRELLPEYMVPAAFVSLPALPLTPNGKLDRAALPEPSMSAETTDTLPASMDEELLAGIWTELLGVTAVGRDRSFFALGGHSLLAMRMVARVRDLFGVELPVRQLFESPTVAALAPRIAALRRLAPAAPPVTPLDAGARASALPLSFEQEGLWFVDRLQQTTAYNTYAAWRLTGALSMPALARAFEVLVQRHDLLRTTFPEQDGVPVQVIGPCDRFGLHEESVIARDAEAVVRARVAEEAARPFDLAHESPFRVRVLHLNVAEHLLVDDHVLIVSLHHIACDGWSLGLISRELSALYTAECAGDAVPLGASPDGSAVASRGTPLPAVSVQYADYAVWQRAQQRDERFAQQLAFWRRQLAGAPPVLPLPADHPRPSHSSLRGAQIAFAVPPDLVARLRTLARREGATLYMALLTAFEILLAKYAGTQDVVIGTPLAGRTRRELENVIGCFVNTLPLRVDLAGDPTQRALLGRVRTATLEAYDHQDVSFEQLVSALQPDRTLSHLPLVQVTCALNDASRAIDLSGLRATAVQAPLDRAKFDLSLDFTPEDDGSLRGALTYSTDLFEAATASRMTRHLVRLIERLATAPDARLSAVGVLDEAEQQAVLALGHPPREMVAVEAPRSEWPSVHAQIAAQAARTPDAVALSAAGETVTYAELCARANRIAHLLRAHGVEPEARVGICMRRGVDAVVASLAVLGTGAAYVPFDPGTPAARLRWLAADAGLRVLLTDISLRETWLAADEAGAAVIALDAPETIAALAAQPVPAAQPASATQPAPTARPTQSAPSASDVAADAAISSRQAAYVIYTSGTTGTPKGVVVEHGSLARLCAWHAAAFQVDATTRATQIASPAFDAAVWEVWPYLTRGAQVAVAPEAVRTDPAALRDWLIASAISIAFVPTPLAAPLVALDWPPEGTLRRLLTGGDRLTVRPSATLPFALINNYGPTESTVVATSGVVSSAGNDTPSIGRAIAATRLIVADEGLNPVPAGVPGALYLGGTQLARGYWNRPALTADRFIPDPFATEPGSRLYRTGDLARWRADGTLEFLGRADAQIKIRGFRIEPGEIESVLRQLPGVADTFVCARADGAADAADVTAGVAPDADARLVAYVVGSAAPDALLAALRERMPAYMVPSAIVSLEELPRTPNGKIDRRALPAPLYATTDADGPASPEEAVIAAIFADLLGTTHVGRDESFFACGGHSLLAMRAASRLADAFGIELPVRTLFEHPTSAALAAEIGPRRDDGASPLPPMTSLDAQARHAPQPLSFAQERLWFLDRLEQGTHASARASGSDDDGGNDNAAADTTGRVRTKASASPSGGAGAYTMLLPLRLSGPLAPEALDAAFADLLARHDVLRTTFIVDQDGLPRQQVTPFQAFAMTRIDLSASNVGDVAGDVDIDSSDSGDAGGAAGAREAAVQQAIADEARRPFDLATGPLLRASLLRLAPEEHVLLLSMHHIISDEWSLDVLFSELASRYEAHRSGDATPWTTLPIQYADYAVWQRAHATPARLAPHLAYWRAQLEGAPAQLALATDHPRPAVQGFAGASERVAIAPELIERLRAIGRREGATLYMVALAAFQLLLSRHAATNDVVVGSPIAGRLRRELEGSIGFFVNTLVLRTDLAGDPTFDDLLRRVRRVTLDAYQHQELPFEQLVDALQPGRSLGQAPLFQVLFTLQERASVPERLADLRVDTLSVARETTKFDLALDLSAGTPQTETTLTETTLNETTLTETTLNETTLTGTTLTGTTLTGPEQAGAPLTGAPPAVEISYRIDLFERETIARLLRQFVHLLTQIAEAPAARLSAFTLLEPAERDQVVIDWNRTPAVPAEAETLPALIAAQVARTPSAIAVRDETGAALTFAELDARANRLARHLASLGVGPDARVAIGLERRVELLVSLLAVLKVGGAYVPLDPSYPAARLAFMMADSGARLLVTQTSLRAALPAVEGVTVVCLDDAATREALEPPSSETAGSGTFDSGARDSRLRAEHLAYVIYTSGSTGVPKGVAITHRSAVALLAWAAKEFSAEERGGLLASTSICFDLSVFELFLPLAAGGCALIVDNALALPRSPLADRVRLLNTVPSAAAALLAGDGIPRGVRTVALAGEPLRAPLADALLARGVSRVCDLYGPSEDTTYSTLATRTTGGPETIGRPIPGTQAYVLDADGSPVPIGVPGELWLGGAGLARGYLHRPGLTAARFLPDPFGAPGARLYRTGDRVRWRADGTLAYLGRLDAQVKLRGFRIELGEIEAAIRAIDGVTDAAVLVRADEGDERLVAWIVGDAAVGAVREALRTRLPDYMMPSALVPLDALPRTPNGKLDRAALPAPASVAAHAAVAPLSPEEEVLAAIWSELLGQTTVDREAHFFEMGGHSLLAMRVVARVRELLGVELSVRTLFEAPTIAGLARQIAEQRLVAALPPITPASREGALPLSFAQERLWVLDQLQSTGAAYHVAAAWQLAGPLSIAALERALDAMVQRHEALRTTFVETDGEVRQIIAAHADVPLPIETVATDVSARLREEATRPFDLATGPLFRAHLFQLAPDSYVLLLAMHHIVSDGWSLGILFRELATLYDAFVSTAVDADATGGASTEAGASAQLPSLPVQYADYAAWQRTDIYESLVSNDLAYWRTQLEGAPHLLAVTSDRPRPTQQTWRGAHAPMPISADLLDRLRRLARREGVTLYMVLLAAFQVMLQRHGAGDDVMVGSPIAGRLRRETEGLIGIFVNTLALRTDLSGDPTWRELLQRVRSVTLGAYEHQHLPFERLVAALQPERAASHAPLVQAMCALHDWDPDALRLTGLAVTPIDLELGTAKIDLSLDLAVRGERARDAVTSREAENHDSANRESASRDAASEEAASGVIGGLTYNADLFDAATAARMVQHVRRALEQMAAAPDSSLSQLVLLDEAERQRVMAAATGEAVEVPFVPVDRRIAAQARKTPTSVAITWPGGSMTYRKLDARADRLAQRLRQHGIGPDRRAGIHLERTPEMVIAVLAVLKAGGAYVPLDPAYPAERLSYMLADAQCRVLLTRRGPREALPVPAGVARVIVDASAPLDAAEQTGAPAAAEVDHAGCDDISAAHLAYVLYTSGSTGRPKGVAVDHAGLDNYLAWAGATYPAQSTVLHSSLSFDFTITNLFLPLLSGGCIELIASADPLEELAARLTDDRPLDLVKLTPTHLRAIGELIASRPAGSGPACLVVGGEALSGEQLAAWRERFPETRLVNEYGPTETVVGCSIDVRPLREVQSGHVPIGRPVWNTQLHVLDAAGAPVATGLRGELFIGGAQVARGYLDRPALTADRFVPDPFATRPGARLYRTGDRARWLENGALEYLGRLDEQVKIRGFRVELGEIELAIRRLPGITDATVIAREDPPLSRRLVAYIVGDADPEALRAQLRDLLPPQAIPSAFVRLARLPSTPNGKVDRKALPAPAAATGAASEERADGGATTLAPRTAVEATLAAIWQEVLHLPRVGVTDSFFALGGDSIQVIQVVSRARRAGLMLSASQLFEAQTIAELGTLIGEPPGAGDAAATTAQIAGPSQSPVEGRAALTPIQTWFFEQEPPSPWHYDQSIWLAIGDAVSDAMLDAAWQAVTHHHDALRLRFRHTGSAWEARYGADAAIAIERLDLSHLTADARASAKARAVRRAQASLDLEDGPIGRAILVNDGADGRALFVVLHHLVVDAVSWRIIRDDLDRACRQISSGAAPDLGPKTSSFQQWAERLSAEAVSAATLAEQEYWLAQSDDSMPPVASGLASVAPHESPRVAASRRTIDVALDADETRALLQEAPAAYRTQINDLLLCALAQAVESETGQRRLRVAVEGHGREDALDARLDLSRTVGWFTGLYPVWIDLDGADDVRAQLLRVKETLRAVPRRGIGYGLLRYLHPDDTLRARLAAAGEPAIAFNYLGRFESSDAGAAAVAPLIAFGDGPHGSDQAADHPLPHAIELTGLVMDARLRMRWSHAGGTAAHDEVTRLASAFVGHLRDLIAHCRAASPHGASPSDFPLAGVTQAELDRILAGRPPIEDLYPLSPMQEGLLFHALASEGMQAYQVQSVVRLEGALDAARFRAAWDTLIARHPILRTAFVWEGLSRPLQRVQMVASMPWVVEDWRARDSAGREEALDAYLAADRARGFALDAAPLLRGALFQVSDAEHWFVLSVHHLLLDGWSWARLMAEACQLHDAADDRATSSRIRRVRPYRDYIGWLQQQDAAATERYWRETLAGFDTPTPLGVDHAAPGDAPACYEKQWRLLSRDQTQQLEEAARDAQVTLNTWLLGAWSLLLSRYTGARDVVFGTTVSGRSPALEGADEMIGLFINTLPARVRVRGELALGPWLATLQREQAAAREYEHASLARVQEWSDVAAGTPLFESHFIFENYPIERAEPESSRPALRARPMRSIEWNTYPLSLLAGPGDQLGLQVSYDTRRFEPAAIARLIEHLTVLLAQMAASGTNARLSSFTLLDAAERACVVETWNQTTRAYPRDETLAARFRAQVTAQPDAEALVWGEARWSYAALDRETNQLAHLLRARGVGPETRVGLLLPRGPELLQAVLAIVKAGGAYVPLEPTSPPARLARTCADAGLAVLLTMQALRDRVAESAAPDAPVVLCLDDLAERLDACPITPPADTAVADTLAYIVYTSGSTGEPKGVMVAHRHVFQLICETDYVRLGPGDRVAQASNPAFDALTFELWGAWLTGATLVGVAPDVLLSPPAFADMLRAERITTLYQTTALLNGLVRDRADLFAPVREVLFGGQAADVASVRRLLAAGGPERLLHMYGPTETTAWCSWAEIDAVPADARTVSVGHPTGNARIYLLDAEGQPVPRGVAGEAYVGGDGVVRGYLGRPGLTASRFVPDPFGTPGARLYRTGDRLRRVADGSLEYVGRLDAPVKIRGFRIELGEIEQALVTHPSIREARVLARTVQDETRLVAYIVGARGLTVAGADASADEDADTCANVDADAPADADLAEDLRAHLAQTLPDYMVPSAFVSLPHLPLTPNGKLDVAALPEPNYGATDGTYVAPGTPVEALLAEVWAELLGLTRVGLHDNFFALGGHSLLAMRLASHLHEILGVRVSPRLVFDAPTVSRMHAVLASHARYAAAFARLSSLVRDLDEAPREAIG